MNDFFETNPVGQQPPETPTESTFSQNPPQSGVVDNANRHFMGQQRTEDVILFFRKHWITILPKVIELFAFFVIILLLFSVGRRFSDSSLTYYLITYLFLLGLTYFLHRIFIALFNHYLNIVILTSYRVIDLQKTLILHDTKSVVDLTKIQDMEKRQTGLMKNILDYGELIIHLSGSNNTVVLHCVPKPDKYFREINRVKREHIMKRQLERMPGGLTEMQTTLVELPPTARPVPAEG